jgi:SPP1 gp7 family putative phage head morphogenesis protein
MNDGLTLTEWEPSFDAITSRFGYGTGPANYTEMVFRTVSQSAYNGGKASEMFGPEGQARAGYWQFSAVMDDRTTDECAALDGQIFAKTDADAMDFIPPLDYNCRSTLIELDDTDVEGETISAANTVGIDVAFDNELMLV